MRIDEKFYIKFCRQPLVISGATGSGKTATLAKLVQLMPDWLGDENVVILPRFLGMARDQMTTQQLLASICQQLYHVAKKQDYVVPKVSFTVTVN